MLYVGSIVSTFFSSHVRVIFINKLIVNEVNKLFAIKEKVVHIFLIFCTIL